MRFVFVTDELPRPDRAGHLAMNHAIIAWLRGLGHQVTVLLTGARLGWPVERYLLAAVAGPEVFGWGNMVFAASSRGLARIAARLVLNRLPARLAAPLRRRGGDFGGADAVLGNFITAPQAAWCARWIGQAAPDAVLVDTLFRAPVLRALGPDQRGMIIAHDVFHRRHQALSAAGYQLHPVALPAALEAEYLNLASVIVAIQPEEAALIGAMCPARQVVTAPMPAAPAPRPPAIARQPGRLVFVGSASLPNLDGLRWFLAEVWPHLKRWRGDVTLDIVGACGAALDRLPDGVARRGQVKSLAPVLHGAALAVAPMRVGSGLKIKLLDYARHGLITVATPASLAGFAADAAAPFIAADTELGFAAAIIRQLGAGPDDARALGYVERHYSATASFGGLITVLGL